MKKTLVVTLALCEEVPMPVSVRLLTAGGCQPLVFRKGEEVPVDTSARIEFYYEGELIGNLRVVLSEVIDRESKWLPLGFSDKELQWKDVQGDAVAGPRALLTVEPTRPLSPIMELTEASEMSILDPLSPTDCAPVLLQELQREREIHSEKQKELQLKIMELQQMLVKERWKAKIDIEQMEQRHRVEIGQMVIAGEKAKSAQKKDGNLIESLKGRIGEAERDRKELESRVHALELQLIAASATISSLQAAEPHCSPQTNSEMQDLRQSVASLQSALAASHAETAQKTAELQQMLERKSALASKTQRSCTETSLADCTVPDLVDDLLREFIQSRSLTVPFVRISEGQYQIAGKKVTVTVRNGALVVRVGGGFMQLDEFLKLYSHFDGRVATPRRHLQENRCLSSEKTRHHRSITTGSEMLAESSRRQDSESSEFSTDQSALRPSNRNMSPRPIYLRETISSQNKINRRRTSHSREQARTDAGRG